MKVSVLLITYNHERFLVQAIESALMQRTSFDFEIVIGEDCSTDGTHVLALKLAQAHPKRVRLLPSDSNKGMVRNVARTLEECRGEYVALLEGDDFWTSPDKLQEQVTFLDSHLECAFCFHPVIAFRENESQVEVKTLESQSAFPSEAERGRTFEDLIQRNFVQTCSVMFRRTLLPEIPLWTQDLKVLDWAVFLLLAQQGEIGYLNKSMANYRIHPGGVWSMQRKTYIYTETIRMLREVDRHFAFVYHSQIRRKIAFTLYQMAWAYRKEGNLKLARRALRDSLSEQPFNRDIPWRKLLLLIRRLYIRPTLPPAEKDL